MTRASDEHLAAWTAAQGLLVNTGARPTAAARTPRWSGPNTANPLDSWEGLAHIPHLVHQEAVAQLAASRAAFLAAVEGHEHLGTIEEIGRTFGTALNALDRRSPFIATIEREDLFEALDLLVDEAETTTGRGLSAARTALISAVESVRNW